MNVLGNCSNEVELNDIVRKMDEGQFNQFFDRVLMADPAQLGPSLASPAADPPTKPEKRLIA